MSDLTPFQTRVNDFYDPTAAGARAAHFKSLHVPGKPLLLANVYDANSARIVGALPQCRALATASWALAKSIGVTDEQLTAEANLTLLAPIAHVAGQLARPLTVDIQDGYGDALEETIWAVITQLGAVGVNLEDSHHEDGTMMGEEEAVERIKRALKTAQLVCGVRDFVINARSDTFLMGGDLDESIRRGKKFLDAGATCVYVFWPSDKDMVEADVRKVIDAFDGRANIQPRKAGGVQTKTITSADVAKWGAARVSVGPQLYRAAVDAMLAAANEVFDI